jgi:signal transduction histidine kinase
MRAVFLERSSRLEEIRNAIYLSGILAEEYFSKPTNSSLMQLRQHESQSVQAVSASEDPNLRGEVVAYWKVLDLMTDLAANRERRGLEVYFRAQLDQRRRSGLQVEISAEDSAGELPDAQRTCIYRIAQEALQNCARHAGARMVRVVLRRAGASVALRVQDDGAGFRPGRSRGMGILGMEERAAQLGGRLQVQSEPGRGTTVTAELPV